MYVVYIRFGSLVGGGALQFSILEIYVRLWRSRGDGKGIIVLCN